MELDDEIVLRERVKSLRGELLLLKQEKKTLEENIESNEKRNMGLRMEANILSALEEGTDHPHPSSSSSSFSEHLGRNFLEKNLMLELQVLNQELRLILPKLEKEAIRCEETSQQRREEKEVEVKKMESIAILTEEEMEKREEELITKKQILHGECNEMGDFSIVSLLLLD